MPLEPTDLTVGPFELQILEPMGRTRLVLDDNETGIAADLTFTPRTAAVEEGRQTLVRDDRLVLDSTRFAQFGHWEGEITYGGEHLKVDAATTPGTKDRSWGVRPVGDPAPPGAPEPELHRASSSCGPRSTGRTVAPTSSSSRSPTAASGTPTP